MNATDFVQRWRQKASDSEDAFDCFFSAWIALVIAARSRLKLQQLSKPGIDRKAVIQYFESHAKQVAGVLDKLPEKKDWLAHRRGTETHQPILDVYDYSPPHLRRLFDTLAQVWSGQTTRKPRWVANASAEVVNHIRNHMFHGLKDPADAANQELLDHVNPILLEVLETCEPSQEAG